MLLQGSISVHEVKFSICDTDFAILSKDASGAPYIGRCSITYQVRLASAAALADGE